MTEPERQLDPRVVMLWQFNRAVRLALFGLPTAVLVYVGLTSVVSSTVGSVVALAMLAFNIVMLIVWPLLEYRHFRYSVREHDLLVQAGVLFRRWSAVPHSRIQHVDTRQGPVERALGLARLQIFTAAGVSADGSIPGLDADEAARLRDELSQKGGADDGV